MGLEDFLETVISRHEGVTVKINSLKESPCTKPGQNFMSVVSVLAVEGAFPNGAPYCKSLFVKRPLGESLSGDDAAFRNEVIMYEDMLPLITSAADVTMLPYPCHYHAASDVIVLDDMAAQGFRVADIANGFDLHAAQGVVKVLAKFHAASYHISIIKKNSFLDIANKLKPLGLMVSNNRAMMETCLERAIGYLEAEGDMQPAVTFLRTLQGRVTEQIRQLREPRHVPVLGHGDFWINNILKRRNRGCEDSEEDGFCIIDFQTCCLQSPAVDFWLLLYTSIRPDIMAGNSDRFKHLYCSTFLETLTSQETPRGHIPSPELLVEELTSKELYGFLAAMAYLPALFLNHAEVENASEEEKKQEQLFDRFVGPQFRKRLVEVAKICMNKNIL